MGGILRQLGWKLDVKVARRLCEKIGAFADEHGHLTLTEDIFLKAMIDNTIARELESMTGVLARSKSYAKKSKKKVTREDLLRSAYQGKTEASTTTLTDSKELVKWTLRRHIVSNSLSGATQLLLLAHTPVSRKVFQFFHCNNIAGKVLLIADYDIDCLSNSYYSFMPVVLVVLGIYTAALPTVILFYLFKHRNELYATLVYQRIGWLYDPYVRGAEFWQVHDVLMKMVLTGMLIYIPATSRAGIAALLCMVACCNLNYFQPHKNKVLFWLSQISFITTASKYVMALLLSVDTGIEEQRKIGWLLIGMDVTFLIASIFSIVISICMLRKKFKTIQNRNDKEIHNQSVTIVPIKEKGAEKKLTEEEEEENGGVDGDGDYRFTPAATAATDTINTINNNEQDKAKPHRIRSLAFTPEQHLGNFGDNVEARQIHDDFHIHEEGLKRKTEQRQKKAKRKTQMRLKARTKLKDSQALSKIKSFSKLKEDEIDEIIELMDHIVRFKDDLICRQHDPSDCFYIIVKGSASVTVNVEKNDEEKNIDEGDKDEEEKKPEQKE